MEQSPSLEDCLKLLKGERDEQRLAGLLLVTKFCNGNDNAALRRVYSAVGIGFLDRLLRTGMGEGTISSSEGDNRDACLQLSVTVLAAFCRVPEIASSEDMVLKIPFILEVLSKQSGSHVVEECFEVLFLVSTSCEDGVAALYKSGGLRVLASQMSTLADGSHSQELAIKLLQLMLNSVSLDIIYNEYSSEELAIKLLQLMLNSVSLDIINNEYSSELSMMVAVIAREFAVLHDALKFEALHLLSAILSSKYSAPVHDTLRLMSNGIWSTYVRVGIMAILQNRVAPAEKLQALILAESVISILGERWLLGQMNLPDAKDTVPADRCLLLVLESSRVEVAVLLNELAYLKYETSNNSSSNAETISLKQRNLAIAFSLLEKIIKLISNLVEDEVNPFDENTLSKVISGLNETVGVVLEYLQDAKDHGQKKGDDILASVRLIGSYLAETPLACREKVRELLDFMLSIEGEDEPSPFFSICFLLPMLCQITMELEGCKIMVSCGGQKAVVECLIKLIGPMGCTVEDTGCIFLACDTILNLLLKRDQIKFRLDESTSVHLLKALSYWTEETDEPSIIMMASSICALIFDHTSEQALLNHPNINQSNIASLSRLIVRSLAACAQNLAGDMNSDSDLLDIITSGYSRWSERFPHIKEAVGQLGV